jgi:hypothetical protein
MFGAPFDLRRSCTVGASTEYRLRIQGRVQLELANWTIGLGECQP